MNARLMLVRSASIAARMTRECVESAEEADRRMLAEAAEARCIRCCDVPCELHAHASERERYDIIAAHEAAR